MKNKEQNCTTSLTTDACVVDDVNISSGAFKSSLVSKNITIFGRRTSVRLEPEMWQALNEISEREKCTVHDICSLIFVRKNGNTSLTAAIRVFLMLYFRAATTDKGHLYAGHGDFSNMKRRARIPREFEVFFKRKLNDKGMSYGLRP